MKGIVFAALVLAAVCLVALVSFGLGGGRTGQIRVRAESNGGETRVSGASEPGASDDPDAAASADSTEGTVDAPAGMVSFLARKCDMCHTVRVAGIGVPEGTSESGRTGAVCAEDDPETTKGGPVEEDPMDLSYVGNARTAEWLSLYLRGEESVEGVKHYKVFGGTQQEEAALVQWLVGLTDPETEPLPVPSSGDVGPPDADSGEQKAGSPSTSSDTEH
ncbi:MAG: hypothetical protein JW990_16400 [Thermoleophilia bacterium]|nr:hypothetical protein [Thermoleophilia bacterium]